MQCHNAPGRPQVNQEEDKLEIKTRRSLKWGIDCAVNRASAPKVNRLAVPTMTALPMLRKLAQEYQDNFSSVREKPHPKEDQAHEFPDNSARYSFRKSVETDGEGMHPLLSRAVVIDGYKIKEDRVEHSPRPVVLGKFWITIAL